MRKIRNFAISILSFIFIVAVGLLSVTAFRKDNVLSAGASIAVDYKETYNIGETIAIQSAEFEYQGKKYTANVLVRFPNGNTYQYEELFLQEPGDYYVEYSAVANDGTVLKETIAFTVLGNVYTFDGDGKYEYGSNAYLAEDVKGLNVALGRNSTFTINTPIDVSNVTKNDSILKFYATPDAKGAAEIGVVYIRLTDVHDKDRYVELQYRPVSTFQYIYASANGQSVTGLRQTSEPKDSSVDYDGFYYNVSHNNTKKAGHVSRTSWTGVMDNNNTTNLVSKYFPDNTPYTEQELFFYNALEVRMDYAGKRVYSQPDGVYTISRCIIADFDDERTLDGKAPWEGFTTGEVFISIYAKDYTATNFNFFITEIYGQDVSQTTMKNEIPPRLSIDTQEYDTNNLPNAIVGKKYNLFDAFALDDTDGETEVSVKVYNSIGAMLSVKDNGFIPTQAGIYTIEYSATDSYGNKATKTFSVKALDRTSISYEFSAGETAFRAGETVMVKALTVLNPSNLYELKIYAKHLAQNAEYAIDGDKLTFVPLYAGAYTITYVYTDYCTQEEISYDIMVESSDLVVFEENIELPKYIIGTLQYPVAEMYGYTFNNGTQKQKAEFYVREGNGEASLVEGDTYSVQSDASSVELIYKIGNQEKIYQKPVIHAIQKAGWEYKVDLSKYFYHTIGQFNAVKNNKNITFEVTETKDNRAQLEVINPARFINDFNIGFHCETGKTKFTGVKVSLTSAYDANKAIDFQFEREVGDSAKVFISGLKYQAEGSVSSKFRTPAGQSESDYFNITYNSASMQFNISGFMIDANQLLEGFDDLFYISFELYGIYGVSSICITRVVNQSIKKNDYDEVKPVAMYNTFKGYYVVGDQVQVPKVKVYDFVDPNPACVVSLQNTFGYLKAKNGVVLDGVQNNFNEEYVVDVETTSRMNFKVSCEDFSGNILPINAPLMVKDVIAPTIVLDVKNNVYKAGDMVTVADYTVADDTTSQERVEVTYYLIYADGTVEYLQFKTFTIDKAGTYMIWYIVRDEAGNNAYANYTIIVE